LLLLQRGSLLIGQLSPAVDRAVGVAFAGALVHPTIGRIPDDSRQPVIYLSGLPVRRATSKQRVHVRETSIGIGVAAKHGS
jgi:hypothetical protein